MAGRKPVPRKRRRSPRPAASRSVKGRRPRRDTLTLQQFEDELRETHMSSRAIRFDDDGHPVEYDDEPTRANAWARRRVAAEKGDLLATYSAMDWCYMGAGGWPVVASSNPDPEKIVEMPVWLLRTLQKIVSKRAALNRRQQILDEPRPCHTYVLDPEGQEEGRALGSLVRRGERSAVREVRGTHLRENA
jgi:hypothetical protein